MKSLSCSHLQSQLTGKRKLMFNSTTWQPTYKHSLVIRGYVCYLSTCTRDDSRGECQLCVVCRRWWVCVISRNYRCPVQCVCISIYLSVCVCVCGCVWRWLILHRSVWGGVLPETHKSSGWRQFMSFLLDITESWVLRKSSARRRCNREPRGGCITVPALKYKYKYLVPR